MESFWLLPTRTGLESGPSVTVLLGFMAALIEGGARPIKTG
jgi:hypothetical protein